MDTTQNKIIIIKENGEQILNPRKIEGLELKIRGKNNTVTIYEPYRFVDAKIILAGDIDVTINKGFHADFDFVIRKTRNTKPNKLVIGKDFQCGSRCTIDLTDAGDIFIGDDAKWSWNIYIKSDDTHPVFDITTKECINDSTAVTIGNHVWIGMNVTILKNSEIKEDSIIWACSVVTKKFEEKNVVIAGNPAKIRKRNVNWTHGSVADYITKLRKVKSNDKQF